MNSDHSRVLTYLKHKNRDTKAHIVTNALKVNPLIPVGRNFQDNLNQIFVDLEVRGLITVDGVYVTLTEKGRSVGFYEQLDEYERNLRLKAESDSDRKAELERYQIINSKWSLRVSILSFIVAATVAYFSVRKQMINDDKIKNMENIINTLKSKNLNQNKKSK